MICPFVPFLLCAALALEWLAKVLPLLKWLYRLWRWRRRVTGTKKRHPE